MDYKVMTVVIIIMFFSNFMNRSNLAYKNKLLISFCITLVLSIFYYRNYFGRNGNLFFPLFIFASIVFMISCEKEGREQAKEFFTNLIRKIRNIAVKNK